MGVHVYGACVGWQTGQELNFLKGLGTGIWTRKHEENRRKGLLVKYRDSIKARVDWREIDPKEIVEYLDQALKGKEVNKENGET